ncbi:MAG: hypothetical protein H8D23_13595 [Candidatus Brocadiales bacterium]|nr:hypothetical protein [Candidatus Brocadiales bacterium]
MMRYGLNLFFTILTCSLISTPVLASSVETVTVTTFGVGISKKEAIQDAIISGLEQVNGQVMSVEERASFQSVVSYEDGAEHERSREELSQDVSSKTQGVVRSYYPLSFESMEYGKLEATVEVTVAVLKQSQQMKRTKIVVVSGNVKAPSAKQIRKDITRLLTSSRKFAVLDRENSAAIQQEFRRIKESGSIADRVRISSSVAPDLLAVINTELTEVNNGKVDLMATFEVIDYSTKQIKFSRNKRMRLKKVDSESKIRRKVSILSKKLYHSLAEKLFQPMVIGGSSEKITIGQGRDFFTVGDIVLLQRKGAPLHDQYTGESLGRELTSIGKAEITFVNPNISIATPIDQGMEIGNQDISDRRIVVTKQKSKTKTIEEMKKTTKGFLDDI